MNTSMTDSRQDARERLAQLKCPPWCRSNHVRFFDDMECTEAEASEHWADVAELVLSRRSNGRLDWAGTVSIDLESRRQTSLVCVSARPAGAASSTLRLGAPDARSLAAALVRAADQLEQQRADR